MGHGGRLKPRASRPSTLITKGRRRRATGVVFISSASRPTGRRRGIRAGFEHRLPTFRRAGWCHRARTVTPSGIVRFRTKARRKTSSVPVSSSSKSCAPRRVVPRRRHHETRLRYSAHRWATVMAKARALLEENSGGCGLRRPTRQAAAENERQKDAKAFETTNYASSALQPI